MKQQMLWQRGSIMLGFYGLWWLRTVGWVAVNGSNSESGWAIVILAGEVLLLLAPWILILGSFAFFSGGYGLITATLLPLTVLSSQWVSGYAAVVLPGLTLLTGWVLATAKLKLAFGRSTKWVGGIVLVLTCLCLLSPQASARLFVAGYHSPYPAVVGTYSADRSSLRADHYLDYAPEHPAVAEPGLLGMMGYPVSDQNSLGIKVYQLGFVHWPMEDRWWVM